MTQISLGEIWALFSIDNLYDQPENNLVAWWQEKPSFDSLSQMLGWKPFAELGQEAILYIVGLWNGVDAQVRPGDTRYRLVQIGEGFVPTSY